MSQNLNSEEPRAGYFYLILFVIVLVAIVFGVIRFLHSVHIF
jgi:hypothetical protein